MAWRRADLQKLHLQADELRPCECCTVLMLREVAGEEEPGADRQGGALAGAPEYAVQLAAHRAALHPAELQELQRVLDAQGTRLPRELFDSSNAELLRYAATHGLLEVMEPLPGRPACRASVGTLQWQCPPGATGSLFQHLRSGLSRHRSLGAADGLAKKSNIRQSESASQRALHDSEHSW